MKKVMIADDDRDVVQMLSLRCQALGLEVHTAHDCLSALQTIHTLCPDFVCLDVEMPGGDGLSVAELLAADPRHKDMPIVMLTGHRDAALVARCKAIGAHYLLKGPSVWNSAGPLIKQLMHLDTRVAAPPPIAHPAAAAPRRGEQTPPASAQRRVLVIDDDPDVSAVIRERLMPYGVDVLRAFSGMQGFWTAVSDAPDVIIMDMSMPDGDGNYILARLQDHSATVGTPVIMLTGQRNPGTKRQMISSGAQQYLLKPLVFEELLTELRRFFPLEKRQPAPVAAG
jgi:CheY-like chemotaxis protein